MTQHAVCNSSEKENVAWNTSEQAYDNAAHQVVHVFQSIQLQCIHMYAIQPCTVRILELLYIDT